MQHLRENFTKGANNANFVNVAKSANIIQYFRKMLIMLMWLTLLGSHSDSSAMSKNTWLKMLNLLAALIVSITWWRYCVVHKTRLPNH